MALISVNGVPLPTPAELTVEILDISKANRNTNGLMIIERIATKRKLNLGWNYLTQLQAKDILVAVSGAFFNVSYEDPQTRTMRTGSFYVGDRSLTLQDYQNGTTRYSKGTMNFIER